MLHNILLVDDDADDRELFTEAASIVDSMVNCYCAGDAEEALNKLNTKEIALPDIIFLDINLPDMSGWECLNLLKKKDHYKDIPVIMYSTSSHSRDKEIAEDLGAICLITKADNYKDLQKMLRVALSSTPETLKENLRNSETRAMENICWCPENLYNFPKEAPYPAIV